MKAAKAFKDLTVGCGGGLGLALAAFLLLGNAEDSMEKKLHVLRRGRVNRDSGAALVALATVGGDAKTLGA